MRHRTTRTTITLAASLAAAAALAPGAAHADAKLAGAPTFRVMDAKQVGLQIAVDEKLARKDGAVAARVTVDAKRVRRLDTSGRHGDDFLYAGTLSAKGFEVGRKYTVRISIPGQDTIVRTVKLHPRHA